MVLAGRRTPSLQQDQAADTRQDLISLPLGWLPNQPGMLQTSLRLTRPNLRAKVQAWYFVPISVCSAVVTRLLQHIRAVPW